MVKSIAVFVFLFLALANSEVLKFQNATKKEFQDMNIQAAEECRVANNIKKGEWGKMATSLVIPDDPKMKCMIACFLEKFGSMKSNGELDWDVISEWNRHSHGSLGAKYIEMCKPKAVTKDKEKCQLAAEVLECYFVEGNKIGLFKKQ